MAEAAANPGFEFDIFISYFSTTCIEPTIGLYRFNQTGQSATKHARLSDPSRTAPFRLLLGGTATWRNRTRQSHLLNGGHSQAVGLPHKGGPRKSTPSWTALYQDVPDSWASRRSVITRFSSSLRRARCNRSPSAASSQRSTARTGWRAKRHTPFQDRQTSSLLKLERGGYFSHLRGMDAKCRRDAHPLFSSNNIDLLLNVLIEAGFLVGQCIPQRLRLPNKITVLI